MNGPEIIIGSATGGGAPMIGALLVLVVVFVTVRWLMQRRAG
jgi:hypothetical protein